jgi:hypothetical protein
MQLLQENTHNEQHQGCLNVIIIERYAIQARLKYDFTFRWKLVVVL